MWLATFSMALNASAKIKTYGLFHVPIWTNEHKDQHLYPSLPLSLCEGGCGTCEMAVLLALRVCEGRKFSEQQWIFEDPLHRLDEVGFQRR